MGMRTYLSAIEESDLEKFKRDHQELSNYIFSEPKNLIELDKAWAGIHFLLTGNAWPVSPGPFSWAIFGDHEIGEDNGYGPARYLTPEQVKSIADALEDISEEKLKQGFNPGEMDKDVYPMGIWAKEGPEGLSYLIEYYQKLVTAYKTASMSKQAMLVWLI
jgi:hypothetical protein